MNGSKSQDGAAVVEFALVLPLFILLSFAIIEFGVIIYDQAVLTHAVRKTARESILYNYDHDNHGTKYYTDALIKNKIHSNLDYQRGEGGRDSSLLINLGGTKVRPDVDIDPEFSERDRGEPLEVTARYNYDFVLVPGFLPDIIPKTFTLTSSAIMRIE